MSDRPPMSDHEPGPPAGLVDPEPPPTIAATSDDLAFLDQVHTAVVSVDRDGTIVRFNRAAAHLTGWPPAEALGRPLAILLPPEIRDEHGRWVEAFARTGQTRRAMGTAGVIEGRRRDGSPFRALTSISRTPGPDGPLFTAVLTDVTEQQEVSAEARLLREALARTATAACVVDPTGTITHASQALRSLLAGTPTESVEGTPIAVVLGSQDDADALLAEVAATGSWLADRSLSFGGDRHELRVVARAADEDSDAPTSVVVTFLDTTHLRQVERDLEHNLAILAKAQQLTHLGSWVWTIADGTLDWSEETYRIFGLDPTEVDPSYPAFLARIHPDDRSALEAAVAAAVDHGATYDVTHRIVRPDGSIRQVREAGEVERDHDGSPIRMIGTVQDITEEAARLAALEASERFSRSVLDSITSQAAILDRSGRVVSVNRAWQRSNRRVGGGGSTGLGHSYLEVARAGAAAGITAAGAIADGIAGVLDGSLPGFRHDYTVETDHGTLWFELRAEPLDTPEGGAVVLHDDITARKVAEEELAHRALHDPLTGLPNRELLLRRATAALHGLHDQPGHVGVLFLDLDRFKVVNDSLGHATGDRVLTVAGERVRGCVRAEDTVCRFGGDEFVVLTPRLTTPDEARHLAERIIAAFAEPLVADGNEFHLACSIGVATSDDPATTAETLLRDADSAMYRAKELGRSRCVVHGAELRAQAIERLRLEHDLRGAAARHELALHVQGQHDLHSGAVAGFEALLRWQHPVHGRVSPDVFIPIAEETGAIIELGAWVLAEACLLAAEWRQDGRLPPTGHLAVNVSPRQLTDPGFVQLVARTLRMTGLPAANLCLEITESVLMSDIDAASQVLAELKELGVRIALDDFGTGHASLGYLTTLPLDELKIDRTFVAALGTDRRADAVASSIIALARALDLEVIAEGIETEEQLSWLRGRSCTLGQGYLLSRPVPADTADASDAPGGLLTG